MNTPENPAPYTITPQYYPGQEVWFYNAHNPPTKGVVKEVRVTLRLDAFTHEIVKGTYYVVRPLKPLDASEKNFGPDWIRATLEELMDAIKAKAIAANA